MYGIKRSTLKAQTNDRAFGSFRDVSGARVHDFCKEIQTRHCQGTADLPVPEVEALKFYLLEHAVAEVRKRREPGEALTRDELTLLERYNQFGTAAALRAAYYLFLACCRETRHCTHKAAVAGVVEKHTGLPEGRVANMLAAFYDDPSIEPICESVVQHMPPSATLGAVTKALVVVFFEGGWPSGSYGGPKWGMIAHVLNEFVHGRISAAMFVDTVWTLSHNTSAVFNKGMLYRDQNAAHLLVVLNAQRAGLIPQLAFSSTTMLKKASEIRALAETLTWLGAPFCAPQQLIDWHSLPSPDQPDPKKPAWLEPIPPGAPGSTVNTFGVPVTVGAR